LIDFFSADWIGKIDGVTYFLGGKFVADCIDCKMVVTTSNKLERKVGSNVIGILKGQVEPDR
jgi:hypothetical protein